MANVISIAKQLCAIVGICYSCIIFAADAATDSAASAPTGATQPPPTEAEFQQWLSHVKAKAPPQDDLKNTADPGKTAPVPTASTSQPKPLTYQQSQQIMVDAAPPDPFPPSVTSSTAFQQMLQQNMPLTPQQVVRLRQLIDENQRAAAIPANVPPKPVYSTIIANLAPGSVPPVIRLAQGYVTSLVFVDAAGQPWPVSTFDIGNPKSVSVQWSGKADKNNKNNIMLIQAISPYSDGNMVVSLQGLASPVTLELVSGQRSVDYRVDVHVPGIAGSDSVFPTGNQLPNNGDPNLTTVLQGIAPNGSKPLSVPGGDCQVWLLGDNMYVRSRYVLLSPQYTGKMVSPELDPDNRMYAYKMQKTPSLLLSKYGNPTEEKIEGY